MKHFYDLFMELRRILLKLFVGNDPRITSFDMSPDLKPKFVVTDQILWHSDQVICLEKWSKLYLDLFNEALPDTQGFVWVPKDDLKTLLQTELSPHTGQFPMGPGSQSQGGDPQEHHVTMARGTLLGGSDQRLNDLQGLHWGVFVQIVAASDSAGRSHQRHAVVLDQDCGSDHSAVQLREPLDHKEYYRIYTIMTSCITQR